MFEPINLNGLSTDTACRWCDKVLTQGETRVSGRVCQRCMRMLQDAGITEEEIFGSAEGYSERKRSAGARSTGRANKPVHGLGISK